MKNRVPLIPVRFCISFKIGMFPFEFMCVQLFRGFKLGAWPDHLQFKISMQLLFPYEESFVRPKELDCFKPWHVTRSVIQSKVSFELAGSISN